MNTTEKLTIEIMQGVLADKVAWRKGRADILLEGMEADAKAIRAAMKGADWNEGGTLLNIRTAIGNLMDALESADANVRQALLLVRLRNDARERAERINP